MIPSQYSGIGAEPKYLIPRSDGFHPDALEIEGGGVAPIPISAEPELLRHPLLHADRLEKSE